MSSRISRIPLATLAIACGAGCHGGAPSPTAPVAKRTHVRLRFAAVVGDRPFACGKSYPGIGATASTITPTDFRFFVSDVQLVRDDGAAVPIALDQDGTWQYKNVALLDFEDGSGPCRTGTEPTRTEISGTIPDGNYRGVRFTLGLPFELNHANPTVAASPLNVSAMFWAWQTGYRFVKIDLSTASAAQSAGFPIHLGSGGCVSRSMTTPPAECKFPNTPTIAFDEYDPQRDFLVADLAALVRGTNVETNAPNTAPGCMAEPTDPDCPGVMRAFGLTGEPQQFLSRRAQPTTFAWDLPAGVPSPVVPDDNPMTIAKVELGRRLFYDKRLSLDETLSCASCHQQARGFADGRARPLGVDHVEGVRNAMGLANVAYLPVLTWANPSHRRLEQQLLVPLFGERPTELGMIGREQQLFDRLASLPLYRRLFAAAFPEREGRIDLDSVTKAIACFERTLVSFDSPYDRFKRGDEHAISDDARRGEELFFSERLECAHCHGSVFFTDNVQHVRLKFPEIAFHNTGLYNLDGNGAYPADNHGIREVTLDPDDEGKFRTPTLRNVAVTAPYMHDGSLANLADVIRRHYAVKGFAAATGSSPSPLRDSLIAGFEISDAEVDSLVAFLASLTDDRFLTDPRHANPWQ
jgi:cytochrome c peroxidase